MRILFDNYTGRRKNRPTHKEGRYETMTNQDIIFLKSQELAENGIIAYTGRTLAVTLEDGTESEIRETEPIHTFAEWKKAGYRVKKGQHAIARFAIWMFTDKPSRRTQELRQAANQDTEQPDPHYYMKESAFFSKSQVELLQKEV